MSRTAVQIKTPDGVCPASVFRPEGQGPWPAVIVLMDAPAIRPTLDELGQRLADHGYYVLLPDLFYRDGPYEPVTDFSKLFGDEEARKAIFSKMGKCANPDAAKADMGAFLDFVSGQQDVKGEKVGVTGYCMGGRLALMAAINFPDRVAAAGAFHPGHLVTEEASSPHLQVGQIKGRVYVGGADEDAGFTREHCKALDEALAMAGVEHEVTIYNGAKHGYVMKDGPVYDEGAAERHWRELFSLLDGTLKQAA